MRYTTGRALYTAACFFCVLCRRSSVLKPHRDVSTAQGTVRGYLTPTHATYFGIPYAQPPTRAERFKAPEPPPVWDGIFEASHKIKCPQPDEEGDENCLVVNVFAPRRNTLLPVYVLVHDGDFKSGWGTYEPPARLLREGFIVVTFNYRLGALGFLCLGTPEALGNAGLKDQIAALYWINRNIESFGGNREEVVVHGVGTAAVSIQLLLLTGFIDGLVQRVIVESGSVLSPSTLTYDPLTLAYQAALTIGYEGENDAEQLFQFYDEATLKNLISIADLFLPCIENEEHPHSLINFDPIQRLKNGNFQKVSMMITYTNTVSDYNGNETENVNKFSEHFEQLLPDNLEFDNFMVKNKVGQIVKDFYFGTDVHDSIEPGKYFDYNYDVFVDYPVTKWAMLYAAGGPHMVYLMKFITDSQTSTDEESVLGFSTFLENLYREKEDDDTELDKLLPLWINFIKLGDPTPLTTSLIPVIWQPVVTYKDDTAAIASIPTFIFGSKMTMCPPPFNQRLIFWDNIYSIFYKFYIIKLEKNEDSDESNE